MRRQAWLARRGVEASRSRAQTNGSWCGRCFGKAYAFRLEKRSRLGIGWQMRDPLSVPWVRRDQVCRFLEDAFRAAGI